MFSHNAELKKELLAALEKVKNEELNDQEKAKCTLKTFELGCSSKSPSIQAVCIGTYNNYDSYHMSHKPTDFTGNRIL